MADLHVPVRAGSDIALLGALINYVLVNGREFREYVETYTNADVIVSDDYNGPENLDGLFSGWDPESGSYDTSSWAYKGGDPSAASGKREQGGGGASASGEQSHGAHGGDILEHGEPPERDPTLQDPRCVFQVLKRHFSRYTPAMVQRICGIPEDVFLEVAESVCANSGRERTTAFVYSVGWTQHTVGVQYIRAASILQLLLGNIGRPGGGILALRGHASIQGSTDIPTLYNILPGYLPMPHPDNPDLDQVASVGSSSSARSPPSGGSAWIATRALASRERCARSAAGTMSRSCEGTLSAGPAVRSRATRARVAAVSRGISSSVQRPLGRERSFVMPAGPRTAHALAAAVPASLIERTRQLADFAEQGFHTAADLIADLPDSFDRLS
jgi:formate dehydrogenase major subunit